jgi:starch phosphorylase
MMMVIVMVVEGMEAGVTIEPSIAYFTMEVGLEPALATYAGGLGVLAGDVARASADLSLPFAVVTLVHRKGYFKQRLESDGVQHEEPAPWPVEKLITRLEPTVDVTIEGRQVKVAAWQYLVRGVSGGAVPVYFLDTDLLANAHEDRSLTNSLYGGDPRYRLKQEAVLGIAGVRMLRALGHTSLARFHMNEGHAALLALELLREEAQGRGKPVNDPSVLAAVRSKCVFTTHTPIAAGHDRFPFDLAFEVIEPAVIGPFRDAALRNVIAHDGELNMTYVGLQLSRYLNGVAKRHGEVSRQMFGDYPVASITNGVHAPTWVSPPFAKLFDRWIPGWREDAFSLRYAIAIDHDSIWHAHVEARQRLIEAVNTKMSSELSADAFTIGFGRRATAYKRPDLLFADVDRLRQMAQQHGPLQVIYAGKAHPHDDAGKELIQRVVRLLKSLHPHVRGVYMPDYDMRTCALMVAGADLWLNTPQPPLEASGTSGMKAALNGVPSLSTLDGWWLEGCIENVTGWSIGVDYGLQNKVNPQAPPAPDLDRNDAESLYHKLEHIILPMYHRERTKYLNVMRDAISLNGAFFNTHRMMLEYAMRAYLV